MHILITQRILVECLIYFCRVDCTCHCHTHIFRKPNVHMGNLMWTNMQWHDVSWVKGRQCLKWCWSCEINFHTPTSNWNPYKIKNEVRNFKGAGWTMTDLPDKIPLPFDVILDICQGIPAFRNALEDVFLDEFDNSPTHRRQAICLPFFLDRVFYITTIFGITKHPGI